MCIPFYNCHSRTKRSVNREPMRMDLKLGLHDLNLRSNGGSCAHNHKDQSDAVVTDPKIGTQCMILTK